MNPPLPFFEAFPSPTVEIIGALDLPRGTVGVIPRRLPAWTRPRITDPVFDFVTRMCSGVRVAARTRATTLELDLLVVGVAGPTQPPATVELLVDGARHGAVDIAPDRRTLIDPTAIPRVVEAQRGEVVTARFTGLPPVEKAIELWLPHTTSCELIALRADAPLTAPEDARPRWVHHGSSISQCGEALTPTTTWPALAASRAGYNLHSLGFSGNAVGDLFVARTIRDLPADVISVEIGINVVNGDLMRRRMFESVLHGFIDTIRDGHPHTPLILIGPVPCPMHEHTPGPTELDPTSGQCRALGDPADVARGALDLAGVREALSNVVSVREDPHIRLLDGRLLLPDAEAADLDDGLHPNAAAYARMGARFAEHGLGAREPRTVTRR